MSVTAVEDGFVGTAEIAEMLGVKRQRVHQLMQRPDFPVPVQRLIGQSIWRRSDIEAWRQTYRPDEDSEP